MNILLIGAAYSDNLGDSVLCQCAKSELLEIIPEAAIEIADIWGSKYRNETDPSNTLRYVMKKLCCSTPGILHIKNYIRKVQRRRGLAMIDVSEKDLVIFAGGQLFQACFINELEFLSARLARLSVPVIYNAIGFDNMSHRNIHKLNRLLNMDNIIAVSTRDDITEAKKVIKFSNLVETYDPALLVNKFYHPELNNKADYCIGIGVITGQQKCITQIIKELQIRDVNWNLFCNGDADDYRAMQDILKNVGETRDKMQERPRSPEELIDTIASFSGIIAFRLHASIIATALSIPSIGMDWNRKVCDFYHRTGRSEYCFTPDVSAVTIIDKMEHIMKSKNYVDLDSIHLIINRTMRNSINAFYSSGD